MYERRIVSVLFADLVGFTSLSERLDAEDVAAIQDAYFGVVRQAIARHGGTLEKFIGDAAMAAFGVPRARDDDPERAVRAGLAIASGVERLNGPFEFGPGELAVRAGGSRRARSRQDVWRAEHSVNEGAPIHRRVVECGGLQR